MRYYTWDGTRLFRSISRAGSVCLAEDLNPFDMLVLVDGSTAPADDWEINELLQSAYNCNFERIFIEN